jgi:NAD-dependent SIR2 family protein deacetylase
MAKVICVKCGKEGPEAPTEEEANDKAKEANWFIGPDIKKCPKCAGWVPDLNTTEIP